MRLPIAQCPCERRTVCRHLLSLSLSIAIAFGLTAAGCKPAAPKASVSGPAKTAPVLELSARDVAEASAESILAGVRVAGTLNPAVRVEIKSQASGQLDAIHADRGTVITQNQVLAILEDRGAKAQVESMKSQLAAAERDFNASEVLFKAGAASERTYVNSKVSVDSAKAQLTQAQLTVERGTVISPLAGTVSERLISAGEAVTPGQKLFTVVNSDNLECAASVLPADIVNVRIGQKALLQLSAYQERTVEGQVERIDPVADPRSRRVGIYIKIPNTDRSLVSGLFATGTILTNLAAGEHKALVVPSAAVRSEKGESIVYVIEGDHLARRRVELEPGRASEGTVEIRSGLAAGARVVLSAQDLKDGMKVQAPAK